MPELPEVEGFRSIAERHLLGRTVTRARAYDDWMLKELTPQAFARRLSGRSVSRVERRGKILLVFTAARPGEVDAPVLLLHFGMTGRPVVERPEEPLHRWDRMVCDLDSGDQFRYRNSRRLGFIRVLTRTRVADLLWPLGPDPLEAPASWFTEALSTRRAPVKAVLLDQGFLAGVGNIYADEALFAAGIAPSRPAFSLAPDEAKRLHSALTRILRRAVKAQTNGRDARFPLLDVRNEASRTLARTGTAGIGCPRCGRPLNSTRIGGRTSFWCEGCQS